MTKFRRVGALVLMAATTAVLPIVPTISSAGAADPPLDQVPVAGGATSGPADKIPLNDPTAMTVDGDNVYVATAEGIVAIDVAAGQRSLVPGTPDLSDVDDIARTSDGTFYVIQSCRIYRVTASGLDEVEGPICPEAIAVGPDGKLYYEHMSGVYRLETDGTVTGAYSTRVNPIDLLFAPGYLYAGGSTQLSRTDLSTGDSQIIAGTGAFGHEGEGGPATAARFMYITSVAVDSDGRVFIYDTGGSWSTTGRLTTIDPDGTLRVIRRYTGDGNLPSEIAFTSAGLNVLRTVALPADVSKPSFTAEDEVREIGKLQVQPVEGGPALTVAGSEMSSWFEEGQVATGAVLAPDGVAVAPTGEIYLALSDLHRVAVVGTDGVIRTFAGTGAAASTGDGGPALAAGVRSPCGVAVDPAGGLFVGEHEWAMNDSAGHAVIRHIASDGTISTIAGVGPAGSSADGAPALSALRSACTIAAGRDGTVFVSDSSGSGFRILALKDGVFKTLVTSGNESIPLAMNTNAFGALYARSGDRYGFRLEPSGILAAFPYNDGCRNRLDVFDAAGNAVWACNFATYYSAGQGLLQREMVDGTQTGAATDAPAYPIGFDATGRLISQSRVSGPTTLYALAGFGAPLASPYFAGRGVAVTDGHVRIAYRAPQQEQGAIPADVNELANTTWYDQSAFDRGESFVGGIASRTQTIDGNAARSRSDVPLVTLFEDTPVPVRIEGARADVFARCDGTVSGGSGVAKIEVAGVPVGPLLTGSRTFTVAGYTFHLNERVLTPRGITATAVRIEFSHPAKSPTQEARSTVMVAHADAHAICPT